MGVDYGAIVSHHLDAATAEVLPAKLGPAAAPHLAHAVAHLVRITNALMVERNPAYVRVAEVGDWSFPPGEDVAKRWAGQSCALMEWLSVNRMPGLRLELGVRCAVVNPGYPIHRWATFLTERSVQEGFRQVCREFGRLLDSPIAVYLPDSTFGVSGAWGMPCTGDPLQAITAWLHEQHGPPAPSIAAIYTKPQEHTWSGDGYFIDTFTDFATSSYW